MCDVLELSDEIIEYRIISLQTGRMRTPYSYAAIREVRRSTTEEETIWLIKAHTRTIARESLSLKNDIAEMRVFFFFLL